MPVTAVCECGKSYTLKDEFANKLVKCPACGGNFQVPESARVAQADPIFDHDRFLIRQKRISISTKYFVGNEHGQEIAFVHRPAAIWRRLLMVLALFFWIMVVGCSGMAFIASIGNGPRGQQASALPGTLVIVAIVAGAVGIIYALAPKRHVSFYRDQEMKQLLMVVRQEFKLALTNARYVLVDAEGKPLATLHKNYLYNIIRRRWTVDDAQNQPLCLALEDSIVLSILRRFVGPAMGLLRTNFIITSPDSETVIGEFNRKLTLFDKYVLDLSADPNRTLDRRIALALGVMLDTGENR